MAAEFEDNYGDQNVDIDVRLIFPKVHSTIVKPFLSVILTKTQTNDDFVDAFTEDPAEIEAFFRAVREAEDQYRRFTESNQH